MRTPKGGVVQPQAFGRFVRGVVGRDLKPGLAPTGGGGQAELPGAPVVEPDFDSRHLQDVPELGSQGLQGRDKPGAARHLSRKL
jgi:hypothetical protein